MKPEAIKDLRQSIAKYRPWNTIPLPQRLVTELLDLAEKYPRALHTAKTFIEIAEDHMETARVLADENAELLKGMQSVFITAGLEDAKEFMETETVKAMQGEIAGLQADLTCRSEQYRQATALIQVQREEIAAKVEEIEKDNVTIVNLDEVITVLQSQEKRLETKIAAKDKEIARLRDALEKIAGGEYGGNTFEAYVDAMIEIANEALKEA